MTNGCFYGFKIPIVWSLPLPSSPLGDLRRHPQEGERQTLHGGYERTILEPAAGPAPAQRLAQWPERDTDGSLPAPAHWNAAGLWGGDAHLLWRRTEQTPCFPLCLQPGAVPCLLDRWGGQHHPVLRVSRGVRKHYWEKHRWSLEDIW